MNHLRIRGHIIGLLIALMSTTTLAQKKVPEVFRPIEDDPNLPRVLIVGDSISIGYTLDTRSYLKGIANVHRPGTNCGPTSRGLKELDKWLGKGKWDVIHFNFGLHDLKYINEKGQLVSVKDGKQQIPPAEYAKNIETLVGKLKKTGAKLIWRNTTPVPEGAKGRVVGDSKKYNDIALKVMKKHNIEVHDMYAYCMPRLSKIQLPKNVHFSKAGSKQLAEQVSIVIKKALASKAKAKD